MKVHGILFGMIFFISFTASAHQVLGRRISRDPLESPDVVPTPAAQLSTLNAPGQQTENGIEATVSFQELAHKVPKPALKEDKRGVQAIRKGDNQHALKHFQKAVNIDPNFATAQNNLGVVFARAGHPELSVQCFKKTLDLVPDDKLAIPNYGIVLFLLKRYHEACPLARRAVKLNPGREFLSYVLGMSLFAQHQYTPEALQNLMRVGPKYPSARIAAADVLVYMGRGEEAVRVLEEYLRSRPTDGSAMQRVEARLQQLRQSIPASQSALQAVNTQIPIILMPPEVVH